MKLKGPKHLTRRITRESWNAFAGNLVSLETIDAADRINCITIHRSLSLGSVSALAPLARSLFPDERPSSTKNHGFRLVMRSNKCLLTRKKFKLLFIYLFRVRFDQNQCAASNLIHS